MFCVVDLSIHALTRRAAKREVVKVAPNEARPAGDGAPRPRQALCCRDHIFKLGRREREANVLRMRSLRSILKLRDPSDHVVEAPSEWFADLICRCSSGRELGSPP